MMKIIALGYNWTFERFLEKSEGKKNVRILHVFLPKNRKEKLRASIDICKRLGIKWSIPDNKAILLEEIKKIDSVHKIDLGVVAAYMMILPPEVLKVPRYGVINLHPSLLPKHRGAHPVNWAIIQGDKYTGCTIHYMTEEVDKGNIIVQEKLIIDNQDIVYLTRQLANTGSDLLFKALALFEKGNPPAGQPQNESEATMDPPRKPEDGEIKQDCSASEAMLLIRALKRPWPGAFVRDRGNKVIIYDGELMPLLSGDIKNGPLKPTIVWKENSPFLMLKNGQIRITQWEELPLE